MVRAQGDSFRADAQLIDKDLRRPHFASLQTNDHNMSSAWKDLLGKNSEGNTIVSPSKMFKLLQSAIDRALTKMDCKLMLDGKEYRYDRPLFRI